GRGPVFLGNPNEGAHWREEVERPESAEEGGEDSGSGASDDRADGDRRLEQNQRRTIPQERGKQEPYNKSRRTGRHRQRAKPHPRTWSLWEEEAREHTFMVRYGPNQS